MITIKGSPHNITETIVGRIQKEHKPFVNQSDIILAGDFSSVRKGYKAIISRRKLSVTNSLLCISEADDLDSLDNNDIVSVEKNGTIRQLYSPKSVHNSIFLTELCNSNCIFCPQPPVDKEDDKTLINLEIIRLIKEIPESIGITGGEPTLMGKNFFTVLSALLRKFPETRIYILSNGIKFASDEFTKKFADQCNSNVMVEIPLYSDYAKIHNKIVGNNTFYNTQKGIYNLAKHNIKVGIRNVISKYNYSGLEKYSEYLYRNFPFASQVAFMQMELEGHAKSNIDEVWIDPLEYSDELQGAVKHLYLRGINVMIFNFQLCLLDKFFRKFAVKSITEWKQNYLPICKGCSLMEDCPGFFKSVLSKPSHGISRICDS